MIVDGKRWDEPGGYCSQCGDKLPAQGRCTSTQCNPPGSAIKREISRRVKEEHQRRGKFKGPNPRREITLDVLEYHAEHEASTVEELRLVVLLLIRELKEDAP